MNYIVGNAGSLVRCPDCALRLVKGEAAGLVDGVTVDPWTTTVEGREVTIDTVLAVDLRVDRQAGRLAEPRKLDELARFLSLDNCPGCDAGPGYRVELHVVRLAAEPMFPGKRAQTWTADGAGAARSTHAEDRK